MRQLERLVLGEGRVGDGLTRFPSFFRPIGQEFSLPRVPNQAALARSDAGEEVSV